MCILKDETKLANLLHSVQSLDGKKAPISQRKEPSLHLSEYHKNAKSESPLHWLLYKI